MCCGVHSVADWPRLNASERGGWVDIGMIAFDIADEAARPRLYSSEREEWVDMPRSLGIFPLVRDDGTF